jgi:hypothetical protein
LDFSVIAFFSESALCKNREEISIPKSSSSKSDGNIEKAQMLSTLLETLRIKLVELTQLGRPSNTNNKGIMMSLSDLYTLDVLVKALKLLTNRGDQVFCDCIVQAQVHEGARKASIKRQKKSISKSPDANDIDACFEAYTTSISKTVSLLLDNFPTCSLDGKPSVPRYDLSNAELCSTLAELGGKGFGQAESSSLWVDAVFSYILPRLSSDGKRLTCYIADEDDDQSAAIDMMLQITRKLLVPNGVGKSGYLLQNSLKRQELLQGFGDVFFPYALIQSAKSIESLAGEGQGLWLRKFAATTSGRTASRLLTSLMSLIGNDEQLEKRSCVFILQMASLLPVYLLSWQHHYPTETRAVLSSMLSLARRWPADSCESSDALTKLCVGYRLSVGIMFNTSKDQRVSIFEQSSETIQNLTVGLVGMLGSPNETLVNSIAKICSRAFAASVSAERITTLMAGHIFEVMHTLRKTMSVSSYLSFLINASGIEKVAIPNDEASNDSVFLYDASIQMLCRFLICSREQPAQVLPIIRPIIEKWLSPPTGSSTGAIKQIIRSRAALSIIAAMAWDEINPQISLCHGNFNSSFQSQLELLNVDKQFDQMIVDSVFSMFGLLVTTNTAKTHHHDNSQDEIIARLLGPVTLVLYFRDGLLKKYLQEYSQKSKQLNHKDDSSSMLIAEIQIKTLLLILKTKEPAAVFSLIRRQVDLQTELLSLVESIESNLANSHLLHLSEKLSHEVDHIIKVAQ